MVFENISDRARKLHKKAFVADIHADTLMWNAWFRYNLLKRHEPFLPRSPLGCHVDIPRLLESGASFQMFGLTNKYWGNKKKAAQDMVRRMHEFVDKSDDLVWALNAEEALAAHSAGKLGVVLGLQGVHQLEGDLDNLQWLYDHGVRRAGLAHFISNEAAYSNTWKRNYNKGLTGFGKDLVQAMDNLGMLVDCAHTSHQSTLDAIDTADNPVIISHTACKGKYGASRNTPDDILHAIKENGGVIGIMYQSLFLSKGINDTVETVIDHIDYVKEALGIEGIDHVALGSDFDGFIIPPKGMRDVRDVPKLTEIMLARDYSDEDVRKVLGGNFLRVYRQVCG